MTRDEAMKLFDQRTNIHNRSETPAWIDRFVALGMLKLDEPKTVEDLTHDAFCGTRWNPEIASDLPEMLARVGLKIVEA